MTAHASNESGRGKVELCKFLWIEFFGYFYIQTGICFVGFCLNLLCLFVFHKRHFHRVVHYFMAALAFFDMLTLLIIMPQGLLRCSDATNHYFIYCQNEGFKNFRLVLYMYTIYFAFPFSNITECMSTFIILMLTWERYQVMKGLYHYNFKSTSYVYSIISTLIIISIVLNFPFFFVQENVKIKHSLMVTSKTSNVSYLRNLTTIKTIFTEFGKSQFYWYYLWMRMVIIPIFVLLVVTILSILLIKVTHRSFKNYSLLLNRKSDPEFNSRQINSIFTRRIEIELQLTSLLILLILLFIFGQFPQAFSFIQLYEKITRNYFPPGPGPVECRYDYKIYRMISYFLSLCTYGFPFFLYVVFDGAFRKALLRALLCRKSRGDEDIDFMDSQETFNLSTVNPVTFLSQNATIHQ